MDINQLLQRAATAGVSDVHLAVGQVPRWRCHGHMQALDAPLLQDSALRGHFAGWLDAGQMQAWEAGHDLDLALECPGAGRWRANLFWQSLGAAASLRAIPSGLPTLAELDAPPVLNEWLGQPHGLLLVTGPTGSGKSTTLAALVHRFNQTKHGHILTLEDPIEFVHPSLGCLVNQRQLGRHTPSFAAALRSALRQDPDLILLGEMRDPETIRLALSAAETGHLVLATLHTASAPQSIDRLVDGFAAEEKAQIRGALAGCLVGVLSQVLCPRTDRPGRTAAYEVLGATAAVRHLVREQKTAQLYSVMQTGSQHGMQTLAQGLEQRVRQGLISPDSARQALGA